MITVIRRYAAKKLHNLFPKNVCIERGNLSDTLGFLRNLISKSVAPPPQPKESQVNDCNELSFSSQNSQGKETPNRIKPEKKVSDKEDAGTSSVYWVNNEKEQEDAQNKVREEEGLFAETKIKMDQEPEKNETKRMLKYNTLTSVEQVEEGSKLCLFVPLDQPKKTLNDKDYWIKRKQYIVTKLRKVKVEDIKRTDEEKNYGIKVEEDLLKRKEGDEMAYKEQYTMKKVDMKSIDKKDKANLILVQENLNLSDEVRTSADELTVNRFDEKSLSGRYSYLPTNHVQVVPRNNSPNIIPNVFVIKGPNHVIY